jgi:hypothetical protein
MVFGWLLPKGDASCGEAGQNKSPASAKTARSQGSEGKERAGQGRAGAIKWLLPVRYSTTSIRR